MASGVSLLMRYMVFEPTKDREPRERDRTLAGKKRIRARKAK